MNYTKYNSTTGEITATLVITDLASVAVNLSDSSWIPGSYITDTHYIDIETQTPVEKPAKPSNNHTWNINTKSWQLDIATFADQLRTQRSWLLSQIDRVNPIWYASLTTDQQTELQAYRTDLLNVPQQSGFPTNITWPSKPAWL